MESHRIERCVDVETFGVVAYIVKESFKPADDFFKAYLESLACYKQPKAPAGVYLLYFEGNPIGSFELVWKKESLELCTVCILPSYQRQGHGAWMVKQAKGMAGKRNISVNRVDSEETRKLYISAGIQVPA